MAAGFVMTMDSPESITRCIQDGVYSTLLRQQPTSYWGPPGHGTFADYASMKPGDNIYFFNDRHLFGIGELTPVKGAVAHLNFIGASEPQAFSYSEVKPSLLYDLGEQSVLQRWLCTFRPSPHFFNDGVDMDEALSAHPSAFRMLRVLWKLSFIKLDFEENAALKDVLLRANREVFGSSDVANATVASTWKTVHKKLASKRTAQHQLDVSPMLKHASSGDGLRSEMALEAAVIQYLTARDAETEAILGSWDYVSHQVAASPFKPPDWMDKVDVFGAAFIAGHAPSIDRLLVAELKKGVASATFVEQVMKYVDWVKDEYAHQDYSHIRAFLVAYDFDTSAIKQHASSAVRVYTVGRRPPVSKEWRELTLVRYRYDADAERLRFEVAASPA
jgi:hypothetical protein